MIHPATGESEGGPERVVDLVVRSRDGDKRVSLGSHRGYLVAAEQSVCNPSLKDASKVSVLNLYTMGPKTIVARRVSPTELEVSFTVEADDEPAKLHGVLATIPIPAGGRVADAISIEGDAGDARPFDCSAK